MPIGIHHFHHPVILPKVTHAVIGEFYYRWKRSAIVWIDSPLLPYLRDSTCHRQDLCLETRRSKFLADENNSPRMITLETIGAEDADPGRTHHDTPRRLHRHVRQLEARGYRVTVEPVA